MYEPTPTNCSSIPTWTYMAADPPAASEPPSVITPPMCVLYGALFFENRTSRWIRITFGSASVSGLYAGAMPAETSSRSAFIGVTHSAS